MTAVLLITHEDIGQSLIQGARHIVGDKLDKARAISVQKDQTPEQVEALAKTWIAAQADSAIVILTDMLGGTPANIASRLAQRDKIAVIAGVNLPMLVRVSCYLHEPLGVLVSKAVTGGLEGVQYISSIIEGSNA